MKKYPAKIKLLLIENNILLREGLISILKQHRDINVITESGIKESMILKIHKLKPDVILLDLGLRSRNSIDLVELIKKEFPQSKVIIMDLVPVKGDILQFVNAGASGFILKDATPDELAETIRKVADGEKILPSNSSDSLFAKIIQNSVDNGKTKLIKSIRMSKKEKEIIILICDGLTDNKISRKLKITEQNLKKYFHNIFEKLAFRTQIETSKSTSEIGILKMFSNSFSIL